MTMTTLTLDELAAQRLASAQAAVSEATEAIEAAPAATWPGLVAGLLSALDVTGRLDLGAVQMALWQRRWRGDWLADR